MIHKKGLCGYCGKTLALRKDGTLWPHKVATYWPYGDGGHEIPCLQSVPGPITDAEISVILEKRLYEMNFHLEKQLYRMERAIDELMKNQVKG